MIMNTNKWKQQPNWKDRPRFQFTRNKAGQPGHLLHGYIYGPGTDSVVHDAFVAERNQCFDSLEEAKAWVECIIATLVNS
jgi:hypothetical protein